MTQILNQIKERFEKKQANIAVIGLGYVGLPLALGFVEKGFKVFGVDKNGRKLKNFKSRQIEVSGIERNEISNALDSGRLDLSNEFNPVEKSDAIIITVPTPLNKHKEPDTTHIETAIDSIMPHLHEGQLVVLESTSYPGTTNELIVSKIEEEFTIGEEVFVAFSPERVDPGNEKYELKDVPKVVGGVTEKCTKAAKFLYEQIIDAEVHPVSSLEVAEMSKLLENIFRNVNIALVNELAQLSDKMDINIWEVIEAAKTKPYGFMPFYPGPGVGGHCIPIDPFYLSWKAKEYDSRMRFIELAGEINSKMPEFVLAKLTRILNEHEKPLKGSRVLLLGVAYKKDVPDTRESPALKLIELLEGAGAKVSYHDPHVEEISTGGEEKNSVNLSSELINSVDVVVLTVDHSKFDYDFIIENSQVLLDTKNAVANDSEQIYKL